MDNIIHNCCNMTRDECVDKKYAPSFCRYCGKSLFENKAEPDLWLIEGCLYQTFNTKTCCGYFSKVKNNHAQFVSCKEDVGIEDSYFWVADIYKICNTPLDFAPEWADEIEIGPYGYFRFIEFIGSKTEFGMKTSWLPWYNCPEPLKNKTLPIPNWAREK